MALHLDQHWSLHRLGWIERPFVLQPHLPVVVVGRCTEAHKQCLGKQVSRRHFEFRRIASHPSGHTVEWALCDPGSTLYTFLNGYQVPHGIAIPLNDRDLIAIGANIGRQEAEGQKRSFLFQVCAPCPEETAGAPPEPSQSGELTDEETQPEEAACGTGPPNERTPGPRLAAKIETLKDRATLTADRLTLAPVTARRPGPLSKRKATIDPNQSVTAHIRSHSIMGPRQAVDSAGPSKKPRLIRPRSGLLEAGNPIKATEARIQVQSPRPSLSVQMLLVKPFEIRIKRLSMPSTTNCSSATIASSGDIRWLPSPAQKLATPQEISPVSPRLLDGFNVDAISRADGEGGQVHPNAKRGNIRLDDLSMEAILPSRDTRMETWAELALRESTSSSDDNLSDAHELDVPSFSQTDEVIWLDDVEPALVMPMIVKAEFDSDSEPHEDDDGDECVARNYDKDEDQQCDLSLPEVICLNDEDLDLSQKPLFNLLISRIKLEQPEVTHSQEFKVKDVTEDWGFVDMVGDDFGGGKIAKTTLAHSNVREEEFEEQIGEHSPKDWDVNMAEESVSDEIGQAKVVQDHGRDHDEILPRSVVSKSPVGPIKVIKALPLPNKRGSKAVFDHEPIKITNHEPIKAMNDELIKEIRRAKLREIAAKKRKPPVVTPKIAPPVVVRQTASRLHSLVDHSVIKPSACTRRDRIQFSKAKSWLTQKAQPPLQYPSVAPVEPARPQGGKKLRWKPGHELEEIRLIEPVGKGLKVTNMVKGRNFDLAVLSQNQGSNFQVCVKAYLNWNTVWIKEQEKMSLAPPLLGKHFKLCHVPLCFSNYNEYCNTFYSLLLHELWSVVYDEQKKPSSKVEPALTCIAQVRHDEPQQFSFFTLLQPLAQDCRTNSMLTLGEGWLAILSISLRNPGGSSYTIKPVFAFIQFFRVRKRTQLDNDHLLSISKRNPESRNWQWVGEYRAQLKFFPDRLDLSIPSKILGLARISPFLRSFQGVESLPSSHLAEPILSPVLKFFSYGLGNDEIRSDVASHPEIKILNPIQLRVVKSVARVSTINMNTPHVSLIQGPPGTGKTSTIVGIILQIHSRWKFFCPNEPLPRILLTAPSNAAVDEVARRLISPHQKNGINLVRIGLDRVVHPDVKGVTLENLRDKTILKKALSQSNRESARLEVTKRQHNMNRLGEELVKSTDKVQMELLSRKIKTERDLLERAKESINPANMAQRDAHKDKVVSKSILENADIVAVTLNSSTNTILERYLGVKSAHVRPAANSRPSDGPTAQARPFKICIMDEASQCTEPESLIPLKLGFTKWVLVGDPEQLPATVKSKEAQKMSLRQSLFKRWFDFFASEPSAYQTLTTQYRMHKEIMDWPSKYFYGGKLEAGPQNRESFLRPYLLLDLKSQESSHHGQIWNADEAQFVADLAHDIAARQRDRKEAMNIEIITFYSKMKSVIEERLVKNGSITSNGPGRKRIQVRTVDSYQGSECDIIIVSCVRAHGHRGTIGFMDSSERLNVALTRAKYALYVVADIEVFEGANAMWRSLVTNARERNLLQRCTLGQKVPVVKK